MYSLFGQYYSDCSTRYFKLVPKVLVFSVTSSRVMENDNNDHKLHHIINKSYSVHLLSFVKISLTRQVSEKIT